MKKKASILGILLVVLITVFVMACNDANIIPVIPEDPTPDEKLVGWTAFPQVSDPANRNTASASDVKCAIKALDGNKYLELSLSFQGTNLPVVEFYGDFDAPVDVTDYVGICFKAKYEYGIPFEFLLSERLGAPNSPGLPFDDSNYAGKATVLMGNGDISGGNMDEWQDFEWDFTGHTVQGWNNPASTDWNTIKTQINKYLLFIIRGDNPNGNYTMLLDDIGFIKADGTKVIYADFED